MGLLVPPLAGCLALSRFIAALISAVLPFSADQIRKEPSLLLLPPFFFRKGRGRPTHLGAGQALRGNGIVGFGFAAPALGGEAAS